jgi:hypothetical protein
VYKKLICIIIINISDKYTIYNSIGLEENTLSIVPVNTHEPLLTTYYKASDQQLISFMLKWPGEI